MPRHLTVNDETVVCGPYLGELAGDSYTTDPDDIDCMECESLLGRPQDAVARAYGQGYADGREKRFFGMENWHPGSMPEAAGVGSALWPGAPEEALALMPAVDRRYLETPFYGSRRMRAWLERQGMVLSRKRVHRLMRIKGLRAIYRGPRTSRLAPELRVYPYLLRNAKITRPNQARAADFTYLPMARGVLSLVAIMDWRRYVVAWGLSNTL